jgi:hypothetical protein
MQVEMKSTVEISIELLAQVFCGLSDDEMCRFFVEVAKEASKVPTFDNQWYFLGGHLRNCECSTPEAREMIDSIHHHMHNSSHN